MTNFVTFRHSQTGEIKTVKIGFSWTLLFFSTCFGIPFFMRKAYALGASVVVFNVLWAAINWNEFVPWTSGTNFGLSMVFGFMGNKLTAEYYVKHGWELADPESETAELARREWKLA